MYRFGNIYVGVSNNWRRLHGIPMKHRKRYPHERKDVPKHIRVKYHWMKKIGCDDELIQKHVGDYYYLTVKDINHLHEVEKMARNPFLSGSEAGTAWLRQTYFSYGREVGSSYGTKSTRTKDSSRIL